MRSPELASVGMEDGAFDLRRLFEAVDSQRTELTISWAALAREVGVSASTIRRFAGAEDAEADGVLALVRWLCVAPEDFISASSVPGEKLVASGNGVVRVHMDSVARTAGDARGGAGRTRTTIQRLVSVARHASQPVASLTRLSDG